MLRVVLLSVTFVFVFAACGSGVNETHALSGWDRPWHDAEGSIVPERVVSTVQGPEHCDWQSTVLLYLGWPLGTHSKSVDDARPICSRPGRGFLGKNGHPLQTRCAPSRRVHGHRVSPRRSCSLGRAWRRKGCLHRPWLPRGALASSETPITCA